MMGTISQPADHSYQINWPYDTDGNLASAIAPGNARYFTLDSQNRLTCVGGAPGSCATLTTSYDASGTRIRDFRIENGASIERLYADQLFTFYRRSGTSGSWEWGDFHIFAFGEEIARRRDTLLELRAVGLPGLPNFRFEPPPAWALGLAAGLALALLGALGAGGRLTEAAQRHPAAAGLAGGLVLLLIIPPLPARAGGGGGETERRWLLNDPIGSATVVLASDGVAEREVKYTPFGKVRAESGTNPVETGVFAGHRQESETGLFYMQARWFNDATGTFASVDPLIANAFDAQSINGYSYARNNPVSFTDPSGAFSWEVFPFTWQIFASEIPPQPRPPTPLQISDVYFDNGSLRGSLPIGAGAPGPSLAQAESGVPSLFNQEKIDRIESKIGQLESEKEQLEEDIGCLSRSGKTCAEIEMESPVLTGIEELIEPQKAFEPRPENHPVRVFVIEPHEISVRQERVRLLERRIDALKAILSEEKSRPGRQFFPRDGS